MKTMLRQIFIVSLLMSLDTALVSCTSTPPRPEVQEDNADLLPLDEIGLEDGTTHYQWENYKGTIPFASEAKKSTAVSGRDGVSVFARKKRTVSVASGKPVPKR
jgi:hypothetical protein